MQWVAAQEPQTLTLLSVLGNNMGHGGLGLSVFQICVTSADLLGKMTTSPIILRQFSVSRVPHFSVCPTVAKMLDHFEPRSTLGAPCAGSKLDEHFSEESTPTGSVHRSPAEILTSQSLSLWNTSSGFHRA